ncbi:MAG: DUF1801 domain-containing protein [Spirochaetaceae bacterium]|nr:DUF1801 domain-containing protein [Spirochaetaceae bacterium]
MKLEANSIEELFSMSEKHEELIRLIDRVIQETAPDLNRYLITTKSICMVGYGKIPGRKKTTKNSDPLISLAPQKHNVNLYIGAEKNGTPLPQYFIDSFGKTAVGKNCIRIRSVKTLKIEVLRELVRETCLWADLKNYKYGRHNAKQQEQ